jgi:hypothetical protein
VLGDKENCPRGCPSKLSSYDQHSIIQQIRSGRLDNAVQVTQFINSTVTTPVTPQTVRNVLKKSGFYSATKKKVPMLMLQFSPIVFTPTLLFILLFLS